MRSPDVLYTVHRAEFGEVILTRRDDGNVFRVLPGDSQRVHNHSPSGFEFGFGGSGPSQLALAILLDFCQDPEPARRWYQEFKWRYVARWTADKAEITGAAIIDFLHGAEAEA